MRQTSSVGLLTIDGAIESSACGAVQAARLVSRPLRAVGRGGRREGVPLGRARRMSGGEAMSEAIDETKVVEQVDKRLFIGGHRRDAAAGGTFKVEDPSTGAVLCEVADARREDGFAALGAAVEARERGEVLRRAYELMMLRQEELALLMTLEMGKPLPEARGEVGYAAEFFRWFAEEAVRISGGFSTSPDGKARFLVMRQPV